MARISKDKIIHDTAQGYMQKTGNPSPTFGTAAQAFVDAMGNAPTIIVSVKASLIPQHKVNTTLNSMSISANSYISIS